MSTSQHIASIRSRASHPSKVPESEQQDEDSHNHQGATDLEASTSNSEVIRKMSVVSLSDGDDLTHDMSFRSSGATRSGSSGGTAAVALPTFVSLGLIDNIQDIELNFDDQLHQANVLLKLEQKWTELSENLDMTLNHLQDCSFQVTESSTACLKSLKDSVDGMCDKVDGQLKAFYHLMTKCDDLTTKLSIATSFRDEIKTLRKSVETLEQLHKNKPQQPRASQDSRR